MTRDEFSTAICTCEKSEWLVPPSSTKTYRTVVRCKHCKLEWVIKRYPSGRAEMRISNAHKKPE